LPTLRSPDCEGLPPPWSRAPLALQSLSEGFQRHVGHAVCLPQDAAQSLLACHRDDHAARADQTCAPGKERFVADSPLERTRFELAVPPRSRARLAGRAGRFPAGRARPTLTMDVECAPHLSLRSNRRSPCRPAPELPSGPNPGANFSSTSSNVGSRSLPTWRSATARSASGRPSRRCFRAPGTSGVGFTRQPTC
jgi:hypothetical protein